MEDVIKEKDRVLFKDGFQLREGTVLEISLSVEYVKLKYPYCGTVLEKWLKMEVVLEVLEKRRSEG